MRGCAMGPATRWQRSVGFEAVLAVAEQVDDAEAVDLGIVAINEVPGFQVGFPSDSLIAITRPSFFLCQRNPMRVYVIKTKARLANIARTIAVGASPIRIVRTSSIGVALNMAGRHTFCIIAPALDAYKPVMGSVFVGAFLQSSLVRRVDGVGWIICN